MNTLVKCDNKKQEDILINNGKKIVENNEFLKDLSNLMENEEFKTFYNKHMTT